MRQILREGYGFHAFITTSLVTCATIAYVFWNENRLKQKRQKNVKEFVRSRQQLENMERYEAQQKISNTYKKSGYGK